MPSSRRRMKSSTSASTSAAGADQAGRDKPCKFGFNTTAVNPKIEFSVAPGQFHPKPCRATVLYVLRGAGLLGSNVKSRRTYLAIAAAIFVSTLGADAPSAE